MTTQKAEPAINQRVVELGKDVWHASWGVCGQVVENAQTSYEKAEKETVRVFDDLVKRGKAMEKTDASDDSRKTKKAAGKELESKGESKKSFFPGLFALGGSWSGLAAKIDQLEVKLDKVGALLGSSAKVKPRAKSKKSA